MKVGGRLHASVNMWPVLLPSLRGPPQRGTFEHGPGTKAATFLENSSVSRNSGQVSLAVKPN